MADERTYGRGRQTRHQILMAAMEQFAETGYRGSSLRDIAARAGLSHPGLLYHFPTKELLLKSVLEHRDEVDSARYPTHGVDGLTVLRNLIASAESNEHTRGIVELFAVISAEATSADHPAHEYFVVRYADLLADVERAFTEIRDHGHLHEGIDPGQAAQQAIALMDGLQVQWLLDARPTAMADALRSFFQAQLTIAL